jgi:hypothetical protein
MLDVQLVPADGRRGRATGARQPDAEAMALVELIMRLSMSGMDSGKK